MIQEDFSFVLRRERKIKGLTQQGLAEASSLSLRYIQELEAGKKKPTLNTLFLLAFGLDTTPQSLISHAWEKWCKAKRKG